MIPIIFGIMAAAAAAGTVANSAAKAANADKQRKGRFGTAKDEIDEVYTPKQEQASNQMQDNAMNSMFSLANSGTGTQGNNASMTRAAQFQAPQAAAQADMAAANVASDYSRLVQGAQMNQLSEDAHDDEAIFGSAQKGIDAVGKAGSGGMGGAMMSDERSKTFQQTGSTKGFRFLPEWLDPPPERALPEGKPGGGLDPVYRPTEATKQRELRERVDSGRYTEQLAKFQEKVKRAQGGYTDDQWIAMSEEERSNAKPPMADRNVTPRRREMKDEQGPYRSWNDEQGETHVERFPSHIVRGRTEESPGPTVQPVSYQPQRRPIEFKKMVRSDERSKQLPGRPRMEPSGGRFRTQPSAGKPRIDPVKSDARSKALGREMVRKAPGHEYEYKPEFQGKPGTAPGRQYGPMAQDLEKSKLGKQAVSTGPDGYKQVDPARVAMASVGALHDIEERLRKLEGSKRGK